MSRVTRRTQAVHAWLSPVRKHTSRKKKKIGITVSRWKANSSSDRLLKRQPCEAGVSPGASLLPSCPSILLQSGRQQGSCFAFPASRASLLAPWPACHHRDQDHDQLGWCFAFPAPRASPLAPWPGHHRHCDRGRRSREVGSSLLSLRALPVRPWPLRQQPSP